MSKIRWKGSLAEGSGFVGWSPAYKSKRTAWGWLMLLLLLALNSCGLSQRTAEPTVVPRSSPVLTFTATPPPQPSLAVPPSEPAALLAPLSIQYQPMAYVRHNQLIVTIYPQGALVAVDQCQAEERCRFAHLRWSPNGNRLAYFKSNYSTPDSEIGLYVWDEQALRRPITTTTMKEGKLNLAFTPAWSPDGNRLAYIVDTGNIVQTPETTADPSKGVDSGTLMVQAEVWVSEAPFRNAGATQGNIAVFTGFGGYPDSRSEALYWREGLSRGNGIGAAQQLHWLWDDTLLFTRSPLGAGIGKFSLTAGEEMSPHDANQWLRFIVHPFVPRLATWTWDRQLLLGRADRYQHEIYALPHVIPSAHTAIVTGSVQMGDLAFSRHRELLYFTTRTVSHITPLLLDTERYQEQYGSLALHDAIPAQVENYRTALFVVRTDSFFQPQLLLQRDDYAFAGLSEAANGDLLFVRIENEDALINAINAELPAEDVNKRIPRQAIMRLRPNQGEPEMLVNDAGQLTLADSVVDSPLAGVSLLPTPTPKPAPQPAPQPTEALEGSLLLPAPLYFLAADHQIWRRAPAGELTQITQEVTGITDYDLSTQHGRLVYVTNNYRDLVELDPTTQQRIVKLADADQSTSTMDIEETSKVRSPQYSPDGEQIGFAYRGINLIASGLQTAEVPQVLVPDNAAKNAEGQYIDVNQLRVYRAILWSPDDLYAALYYGGWEWAGYDLYNRQTGELRDVTMPDGRVPFSTNRHSWWWGRQAPIAYISTLDRRIEPGLFRYALDQATSVRLQTQLANAPESFPRHGTLTRGVYEADNGDLRLFLNTGQITSTDTYTEVYHLYDLTTRTRLNETAVTIGGDVLWAEDGSGALVVIEQTLSDNRWSETTAGAILWVSANDNTTAKLDIRGHQLRWGKNE